MLFLQQLALLWAQSGSTLGPPLLVIGEHRCKTVFFLIFCCNNEFNNKLLLCYILKGLIYIEDLQPREQFWTVTVNDFDLHVAPQASYALFFNNKSRRRKRVMISEHVFCSWGMFVSSSFKCLEQGLKLRDWYRRISLLFMAMSVHRASQIRRSVLKWHLEKLKSVSHMRLLLETRFLNCTALLLWVDRWTRRKRLFILWCSLSNPLASLASTTKIHSFLCSLGLIAADGFLQNILAKTGKPFIFCYLNV